MSVHNCDWSKPVCVSIVASVRNIIYRIVSQIARVASPLKSMDNVSVSMGVTICDTIETLLASVQDEIDDQEIIFKLRTARQLTVACKEQTMTYRDTLENVELDEESKARLTELG